MRKGFCLSLAVVSLLASCQSEKRQQRILAEDTGYCRSIGAKDDAFTRCMLYRDQARREDDMRRAAALRQVGAAMIVASQQYAQQRRQRTTICNRLGQSVVCNTY